MILILYKKMYLKKTTMKCTIKFTDATLFYHVPNENQQSLHVQNEVYYCVNMKKGCLSFLIHTQ